MRLMTIFQLATRTEPELQALARLASVEAALSPVGSLDRQNAYATLDNIAVVIRSRPAP